MQLVGSMYIINLEWITLCGRDSRMEQGQRMIMKERHSLLRTDCNPHSYSLVLLRDELQDGRKEEGGFNLLWVSHYCSLSVICNSLHYSPLCWGWFVHAINWWVLSLSLSQPMSCFLPSSFEKTKCESSAVEFSCPLEWNHHTICSVSVLSKPNNYSDICLILLILMVVDW